MSVQVILKNRKRYAQSCDCNRRKFIKDKDWHIVSHAHSVDHFVTSVKGFPTTYNQDVLLAYVFLYNKLLHGASEDLKL